MKLLLHAFVDWLECCDLNCGPCGSPFEEPVDPVLLMKAETALDWARASGKSVELFTTTIDPKPLLAALVLGRARVNVESVFQGELDDDDFERLASSVSDISRSGLILVQDYPPAAVARTCFFGGPLFAVLRA
jgi:hypothetical protein